MKEDSIIIDYVCSGFAASFRLGTPFKDFEEGIVKHLVPASQYLKDKMTGHVKISGLFNAFTEESFATRIAETGYSIKQTFPDSMYADSGGLQVLTQGKQIDTKMKHKIYGIQAKYADYAMSFDEMPFRMVDGQKIYQPETVSSCGTKAGENLKDQIKYFDTIGADTKIIPIVQGLGLVDMSTYTLNMVDQLNEHELDKLECLAVGGIQSEFELLERSVNIYKIEGIPDKVKTHFHVLGVTGFRKLLPVLIGIRNGLMPGIHRFSFDSTTLSKSYLLGNIQPSLNDIRSGKKKRSLGKIRDAFVEDYYQQMFDFWKDNPDNIFDDVEDLIQHSSFHGQYNDPNKPDLPLEDICTTAARQYKSEKLGVNDAIKTIVQKYVYVYYNTFKFMEILEGYLQGTLELSDFMGTYKHLGLLQALENVSNHDEFDEWYLAVRKMAKVDKKTSDDGDSVTTLLF